VYQEAQELTRRFGSCVCPLATAWEVPT